MQQICVNVIMSIWIGVQRSHVGFQMRLPTDGTIQHGQLEQCQDFFDFAQ